MNWSCLYVLSFLLRRVATFSTLQTRVTAAATNLDLHSSVFSQCVLGHHPRIDVVPMVDIIPSTYTFPMSSIFRKSFTNESQYANALFQHIRGVLPRQVRQSLSS